MLVTAAFAVRPFAVRALAWAAFSGTVLVGTAMAVGGALIGGARFAAMRMIALRTIGPDVVRTRAMLAAGCTDLWRSFGAEGVAQRIVGTALGRAMRAFGALAVVRAFGPRVGRSSATVRSSAAAAMAVFTTATATLPAFAARSVFITMRMTFRHREDFAADVVDDFDRLLYHPFDSANFLAL